MKAYQNKLPSATFGVEYNVKLSRYPDDRTNTAPTMCSCCVLRA